mmetsp:Transcript_3930/g.8671  ORF Transcript_3930/g.8671 Transcript_3930/m.8671 type:complete len:411 (-) Transcript_3930:87-1319(-)
MSDVHVGMPPDGWRSSESRLVHFHQFGSMSSKKGYQVKSSTLRCCNHEWKLQIYPAGCKGSSDGMVAIFLWHCSGHEISANATFVIREQSGKVLVERNLRILILPIYIRSKIIAWGFRDFVQRAKVIDPSCEALNNGTLTVEVRITPDEDHCCVNYIPKYEFGSSMVHSFMDKKTADITFEVKDVNSDGEDEEENQPVIFYAHRLILKLFAKGSALDALCDAKGKKPVSIMGIDPHVFHLTLYYIYGGSITTTEWEDHAKDFIDSADRFGIKNLKIEAEAHYVKNLNITVDNVINELVYADRRKCLLLKEAAKNFVLENGHDVLASDSFESFRQSTSIMREIISLATRNKQGDDKEEVEDLTNLSIDELKAKVSSEETDIDGPRQTLSGQPGRSSDKKRKTAEWERHDYI